MRLSIAPLGRLLVHVAVAAVVSRTALAQTPRQVVSHVLEEPGWVGITPDSINPLVVGLVAAGTPAASAGILPGDRIVSIDGAPATTRRLYLRGFPIGEIVQMAFTRGTRRVGTFSFAVVENPYAAYLAAQAREDSVRQEARTYRQELARSAAAGRIDTSRIVRLDDRYIATVPAAGERARAGPNVGLPPSILEGTRPGEASRPRIRPPEQPRSGSIDTVMSAIRPPTATAVAPPAPATPRPQVIRDPLKGTTDIVFNVREPRNADHQRAVIEEALNADAQARQRGDTSREARLAVLRAATERQIMELREAVAVNNARATGLVARIGSRTAIAGAEVATLNEGLASYFGGVRGVLILNVPRVSPAADAGLQSGDIIERVNQTPVRSIMTLLEAVGEATGPISLTLLRRGDRVVAPLRR